MAVLLWRTAPRQTHATPDKGLLSQFWAGSQQQILYLTHCKRHTGSRGNGAEADSTMQNKNPQPTCKSTSTSHRALASPCEETSTHTRAHAHTHALVSDPCAPTHMHHHVIKHTQHAVIHTHTPLVVAVCTEQDAHYHMQPGRLIWWPRIGCDPNQSLALLPISCCQHLSSPPSSIIGH